MPVWSAWCLCDLHDVRVISMMSVWSAWCPCDLHYVHVICMMSVWAAWCPCDLHDVHVTCMMRYCLNVLHALLRVLLLLWNAKELGPKGVTFSWSLSWACDAILVHMTQGSFTHRHTHIRRPFPLLYMSSGATGAILSQRAKCTKTCISMMLLNGMLWVSCLEAFKKMSVSAIWDGASFERFHRKFPGPGLSKLS